MTPEICIDPVTDPLWQNLVCRQASTVFHSPAWLRVLQDTYGFNIQAAVVLDDSGQPRSGIAYCTIEDMMDPRIISLPFTDFCDPLIANRDDWHQLIASLLNKGHRISLRCLRNQIPLTDTRFSLTNQAKWHYIDLQDDVDILWQKLDGSARRAIGKAERSGITVRCAQSKEDLRAFYELHLRVRKYKYRLLAQPYQFFEQIWERFLVPGNGALLLACAGAEVLGGVLYLIWQNTFYYKFNASNPARTELRPNDLVVWKGMQYGKEKGLSYLDFGLSDWDQEGLLRYKRKFATDEKTISFLSHIPEGLPSPTEKKVRQLLPQLTDLFVTESVPDDVTELAGNVLYRFFT